MKRRLVSLSLLLIVGGCVKPDRDERVPAASALKAQRLASPPAPKLVHPNEEACREGSADARQNLRGLYIAEESYRAEYDTYTDDSALMGFVPKNVEGELLSYEFRLLTVSQNAFQAEARGIREMAGDVWTQNQDNEMRHAIDACAGR